LRQDAHSPAWLDGQAVGKRKSKTKDFFLTHRRVRGGFFVKPWASGGVTRMEDKMFETQTFHLNEDQREAALLHAYMELQLPVASAKQAAQADMVLLDESSSVADPA
jgi:hypothetical protein